MQYQIPKPSRLIPGAPGLIQGFVFPPAQPLRTDQPRQMPALATQAIHGSAAVVAQTHIFPVNQPRLRQSFMLVTRNAARAGSVPDQSSDFLAVKPMQPDDTQMSAWLESTRYRQVSSAYLHTIAGPVTNTLLPERVLSQPTWPSWRPVVPTTLPILGPPATPTQTDTFAVAVMPQEGYYRQPIVMIRRSISGTVPLTQTPVQPVNQPTAQWYRRDPQMPRVALVQLGSPTQATFIYPTNQPDRRAWYVLRLAAYTPPKERTDGPPRQGTFVFPLSQPSLYSFRDGTFYARVESVAKQLTGAFTPPAAAQTYLYPTNQPDRQRWPRPYSEQVEPPKEIRQGQSQMWPVYPANVQPDRVWWKLTVTPTEPWHDYVLDPTTGTFVRRPRNWRTGGRSPK